VALEFAWGAAPVTSLPVGAFGVLGISNTNEHSATTTASLFVGESPDGLHRPTKTLMEASTSVNL